MAPLIGKEMSEAIFLDRFASLCVDPLFHVRKVCAANFGDFSSVVGMESTEKVLLPKFFYLCEDGVWGVRKACADVFMPVSCVCSPSVRKAELSPIFINLLKDQSRWVRMTAYQALGPFISTFADSNITALLHNDNGEIVITDRELLATRLEELEKSEQAENIANQETRSDSTSTVQDDQKSEHDLVNQIFREALCDDEDVQNESEPKLEPSETEVKSQDEVIGMDIVEQNEETQMDTGEEEEDSSSQNEQHLRKIVHSKSLDDLLSPEEERAKKYQQDANLKLTSSESYNNFLYWRDPLPILEDLTDKDDLKDGDEKAPEADDNDLDSSENTSDKKDANDSVTMEVFRPESQSGINLCSFSIEKNNNNQQNQQQQQIPQQKPEEQQLQSLLQDPALPRGPPATCQSIVPQLLVDHFVSMTDPSRAQTVDSEIAHHCAFSLPAVALTLGRNNWPLLRETYDLLASDMQWKVRRTLASSIHELGVILGQEAVVNDLIPIFNGFLKDLDEVRIGLLKHLSDFLKLLPLDLRRNYLLKMQDFLYMDNDRNWRFRQELAVQLGLLIPLYAAVEVKTHLAPIAVILIRDKVAAVRLSAVQVHSIMVKTLLEDEGEAGRLVRVLLADLVGDLVKSDTWIHRQTYASLALTLFEESALDHTQFAQDVLPNLMELAEDRVPNVRLAVARALKQLKQATYFTKEANPHSGKMEQVIHSLTDDKDPDVRAFFAEPQAYDSDGEPINDISSLPV